MSVNEDLSILLTLKDRVSFTFRWLAYANQVKLPFKVFIADGGADESLPRILADRAAYPNVDYEYIRFPYDKTPFDYYAKVDDALARVKTPFVVLADNDDFYVVAGLLRSIEFLKDRPDFSSSRGIIGGFRIEPDPRYRELSSVYGSGVSFVRQVYPDHSNLEETAVARVDNYFSSYRANWYDVFRTGQTREAFQALRSVATRDLILSQHIAMLLGVIAGKVHIDSYLYLVRQLESPESCDRSESEREDLFDRMLLETWSEDFKGFLNVTAAAISRKDGISVDEARIQVKRSYRKFIGRHLIYDLQRRDRSLQPVRFSRKAISYAGPLGSALHKLYPSLKRAIGSGANGLKYIPSSELSAGDKEFRLIRDFLAAQPQLMTDSHQTG